MKFKIRFADQIVGFFIIFSLVALAFVIVMLGRSQRWFAKDASYNTVLPTAGGLSKNMAVQYKGFTIGHVTDFQLTDNDFVGVEFLIHEEYRDRVTMGSMVELQVSPIGLGNSFIFYAGLGREELEPGAFIPIVGSTQAKEYQRQGLAMEVKQDDSITALVNRVNTLLDELNNIAAVIGEALGPGSSETDIGKLFGSLVNTMAGFEDIPGTLDVTLATVLALIDQLGAELTPTLENLSSLTTELNNPDGLVYSVLDTEKDVYPSLVLSLQALSAILKNLEKTTDFIPGQLPQLGALITDLRGTMKSAEDVLTALTNNPLLKKGVPERLESQGNSTNPRNIQF